MEKWKSIPGYEGIYEVSNEGRVRTSENKVTYSERHGKRSWKQRILKQKIGKDDCHRVTLYKDKKAKTLLVHRLVAIAFLDKPDGKDYINHLDGNRNNNYLLNLEWCDHKENNNHAFDNGLIGTNNEIMLMDEVTGEWIFFRSKAKASLFMDKNIGFVHAILKNEKRRHGGYFIA